MFLSCFCRAGRFSSLCNMESVSLEPLKKNIDVDFVRELLEEFQQKTGSQVARNILDNWDAEKGKFVKVRHSVLSVIGSYECYKKGWVNQYRTFSTQTAVKVIVGWRKIHQVISE